MRTHSEIIKQPGASAVRERADLGVSLHTVRSWQQRGAIPGEYWLALHQAGIATLEELATAAAAAVRKSVPLAANDDGRDEAA